jgi:serine phosphatase RsbU (regulator of sigma subunit)
MGSRKYPDGNDEEFGLDRLEQLLSKNAAQPLPQLWDLIMGEVKPHGVQQDDQTLLLLRIRK